MVGTFREPWVGETSDSYERGVKRGLLMAAEIVEDARNVDIELCDMLAEQIRAKASEVK